MSILKLTLRGPVVLLCLFYLLVQASNAVAPQVIYDVQSDEASSKTSEHITSQDGSLQAFAGSQGYKDGIYVTRLASGQSWTISGLPRSITSVSFAPDGQRLLFLGANGLTRYYKHSAYVIRTDGTQLVKIAAISDSGGGPETDVSDPSFSPDGTHVLLKIDNVERSLNEDGDSKIVSSHSYVGIVSSYGGSIEPRVLAEGRPLFFSNDGSRIYYRGPGRSGLFEVNVETQVSSAIRITKPYVAILGRVPGSNVAFISNPNSQYVALLSLDGSSIPISWFGALSKLPIEDSKGRLLQELIEDGPKQLLVRYGCLASFTECEGETAIKIPFP